MKEHLQPYYPKDSQFYPNFCFSTMLGIESSRNFHIRLRTLDDYILMYTTTGVLYCRQKGVLYEIKADEYILLDLHLPHEYWFDPALSSEIYWMHINGLTVKTIMDCISQVSPLPIIGRDPSILEAIKRSLCLTDPRQRDLFAHSINIASTLLHILEMEYSKIYAFEANSDDLRFREQVESVILRSDGLNLNLNSLCEQFHLSKYYFSRKFKKVFGTTPMKYVLGHRIEKAKNLLKYTDMKIGLIALETGFQSPSNFSTVFRREVGLSPLDYRLKESH